MNRPARPWIALGTACALILQIVLTPAALAFDETLPGGTSPQLTAPPSGGQGPANWWSVVLDKIKSVLDPVDVHLGDFVLTRQDVLLPGRGLSVDLTFTYRSRSGYNGPFGYGWDMTYNKRIKKLANNNLVVLRGANRKDEFTISGSAYSAPSGIYDTLVKNTNGTYTLTSKHGDKEFYDANGNLTRVEDRNGNALTFTYDPAGRLPITGRSAYFVNQTTGIIAREYRLTQITDTIGRAVSFSYTAEGRVSTIAYGGRVIRYEYDAAGLGDLLRVIMPATPAFPSGTTTSYAYDTRHNLTTITDAKGQTYLTNIYDAAADRVTRQTYGTGTSTIVYGTDINGNKTSEVTDRKGFRTHFTFDAAGHITRQEEFTDGIPAGEPFSYVTTYEYSPAGERTRIVFPRGNAVESTYDAKGNLLMIRRKRIGIPPGQADPSDLVTTFTYESRFNFVKTARDARGNVTTSTYDYELGEPSKGNLRKVASPSVDSQTIEATFSYNSFGQLDTVTDPNGNATKHVYDAATGYLLQVTHGFGSPNAATTMFGYDAVGNIISSTDANGRQTTFESNAQNQLTKVTAPAPFNFATYHSYDANGNLIQIDRQAKAAAPGPRPAIGTTTALDDWQSTVYTYTSLDQLASVKNDLGHVTQFTYDANGNRTSVQDAKLNATTLSYDERNLLWKITDADLGLTEQLYDSNANLASVKDAKGNVTAYVYDEFDRQLRMTYVDGSFEQFAYDAASNLTQRVTPANQTITYDYDALNRLKTKTTPTESTAYTYDRGSRLTGISDADAALGYAYDALNRTTQVTTDPAGTLGPVTMSYLYDPAGNRTRFTYPDASFLTYTYDELNRLTAIKDAAAATIAGFIYDALSRRSQLSLGNGAITTYQYDALGRLTGLQSVAAGNRAYTYDQVGNRLTMTDPAGGHTYSYDKLYQLTLADYPSGYAFTDTPFAYDKTGNRTTAAGTAYTANLLNQYTQVGSSLFSNSPNGNLTGDGTRTYTYDSEHRLLTASAAGLTASATYDPLGRRLTKTLNGTITRFLYDGDRLIAETDGAGAITAKYVFGPGIDEPLRMTRGATTSYYHADGLGSVVALTNTTGTIVERASYDVYGQTRVTSGTGTVLTQSALGNRFFFTGREHDQETGLYHYRARAYDPRLGRFLQRDPVGYAAGPNLYSYVENNPTTWVDPLGLEKERIGAVPWWLVAGGRILFEPLDWALTINSWGHGGFSPWQLMALLPAISGPMVRGAGRVLGSEAGLLRLSREEALQLIGRNGEAGGLVIGRGGDLGKPGAIKPGEYKLQWPETPSAKSEWKTNSGLLRQEMQKGNPIRDASPGNTAGMHLNAERNLLRDRGWRFDEKTSYWMPPE